MTYTQPLIIGSGTIQQKSSSDIINLGQTAPTYVPGWAIGTVYQNTTGAAIFVSMSYYNASNFGTVIALSMDSSSGALPATGSNGTTLCQQSCPNIFGGGYTVNICGFVPKDWYFIFTKDTADTIVVALTYQCSLT